MAQTAKSRSRNHYRCVPANTTNGAEIDIEGYNDGTGKGDFITYADEQRTHHVAKDSSFDPSADFHTYRFDYLPNAVKFYIDGDLKQVWTDSLPQGSMKLLVNTWFHSWLEGLPPSTTKATRVDWIDYQQSDPRLYLPGQ